MDVKINSNSDVALVMLQGKVGWDAAKSVDEAVEKLITKGCKHIVFNLDEVTFLGSGGIGVLLYNIKQVQSRGGDIYIVSHSDYIQYLFQTIGFNRMFAGRMFDSFEEFAGKVLEPLGLSLNLYLEDACELVGAEV